MKKVKKAHKAQGRIRRYILKKKQSKETEFLLKRLTR